MEAQKQNEVPPPDRFFFVHLLEHNASLLSPACPHHIIFGFLEK